MGLKFTLKVVYVTLSGDEEDLLMLLMIDTDAADEVTGMAL